MKNTLLIGIEDTTVNVRLISSLDDGTNRLFVVLSADLSKHPFISINSGANIYATADEWSYEIEPTTWRGSSTFTITAGDDLNAGTTYTVSQVPSNVTTNVGLEHSSGNAYRLTYTVGSGVDTANDIVTFTSSDVADGQATAWTSVAKLESGETHASMFAKISQMFKNVRYLYKTLGNTDLSAIADGTVTKAIKDAYSVESVSVTKTNISGGTVSVTMIGKRLLLVHMSGIVPTNINSPIIVTIPSSISIDTDKSPTLEYMAYSGFSPNSELHSVLPRSAFTAHSWQVTPSSTYPYCYMVGCLPVTG